MIDRKLQLIARIARFKEIISNFQKMKRTDIVDKSINSALNAFAKTAYDYELFIKSETNN